MARPRKPKGGTSFLSSRIYLTENQENRVLDILGIDTDDSEDKLSTEKAGKAIIKVETVLGTYEGLVETLDKAPTNSALIHEINGDYNDKTKRGCPR